MDRQIEVSDEAFRPVVEQIEALTNETEIENVKLVRYKVKFSQREDRHQVILKVTTITPNQKKYFNMIGLKNPSNIELFTW